LIGLPIRLILFGPAYECQRLSALHDAAFDSGLITLDEKLRIVLSKELRNAFPQDPLHKNFAAFEQKPIRLLRSYAPGARQSFACFPPVTGVAHRD
jgi:hypothetical protein